MGSVRPVARRFTRWVRRGNHLLSLTRGMAGEERGRGWPDLPSEDRNEEGGAVKRVWRKNEETAAKDRQEAGSNTDDRISITGIDKTV